MCRSQWPTFASSKNDLRAARPAVGVASGCQHVWNSCCGVSGLPQVATQCNGGFRVQIPQPFTRRRSSSCQDPSCSALTWRKHVGEIRCLSLPDHQIARTQTHTVTARCYSVPVRNTGSSPVVPANFFNHFQAFDRDDFSFRFRWCYSTCLQFSLQVFDSPGILSPRVFCTRKATYVTIVWPCAWRILNPETTRDRYLRDTNRA